MEWRGRGLFLLRGFSLNRNSYRPSSTPYSPFPSHTSPHRTASSPLRTKLTELPLYRKRALTTTHVSPDGFPYAKASVSPCVFDTALTGKSERRVRGGGK